jgi:hypothetical protein
MLVVMDVCGATPVIGLPILLFCHVFGWMQPMPEGWLMAVNNRPQAGRF